MQMTRITTGIGHPHGLGHSNSWKYFSPNNCSGTINCGNKVYYSVSSKYMNYSFEERKAISLKIKQRLKKDKQLIKTVQLINCK